MNLDQVYQDRGGTAIPANIAARKVKPDLAQQSKEFAYEIASLCLAGDIVVSFACLLAAFWLRFDTGLRDLGVREPNLNLSDYFNYIVCGSISLLLILAQKRMYEAGRLLQRESRIKDLIVACVVWGALFLGISLLFKFQPPLSRVYVASATVTTIGGLSLWRSLLYSYLRQDVVATKLQERVLVIGWSKHAERLEQVIARDFSHPYKIVGCVPGPDEKFQLPPPKYLKQNISFEDLRRVFHELSPDIVLVADANLPVAELEELASLCEKELVQFKVVPSYFNILISGLHLETMGGIPMIGLSGLPLDSLFNRTAKRAFDIIGAICGLILSAPVIAVFGTLVYFESPGPIFYRQRRLGRNGKAFDMWKIRSMRPDAEKDGQAGWSKRDDPRRLRIGSFMRRWNIDETPQFWNVFRGEMSLVGPRPERPEFILNFKDQIPHYNARHTVKPGITGWAQVNGLRGDTDLLERVTYDLYYVEHWSLLFDIQTIFLTLFKYENAH